MTQADIDRNEIIELVNQAGCVSYSPPPLRAVAGASMTFAQLDALIKLAAAKEREACAKVCDIAPSNTLPARLAMQIRARGNKE